MGIRILEGTYDGSHQRACFVDSVTGVAFGQLFESAELAEAFLQWSVKRGVDLRTFSDADLEAERLAWSAAPPVLSDGDE